MSNPEYLNFLNPIHIIWRKGTTEDPYKDRIDISKVVNQRIQLLEIPDNFSRVRINGFQEINYDDFIKEKLDINQFYVDYTNGFVYFHQSKEGETITCIYKGRGFIAYPSERIYHYDNSNSTSETLFQIIEEAKTTIVDMSGKTADFETLRKRVIISTANANRAADEAKMSGKNLETAINLALEAQETTKLIYKPFVKTYRDILTTYPHPKIGWTVQVYDTGIRYRFDGKVWTPIDSLGGNVPLANENLNGLMSKEDYKKLKTFPLESIEKVIVFMLPSYLPGGIQDVHALFPYNGQIIEIKALCSQIGTQNTLINIEKSTDMVNWSNVLSSALNIPIGNYFDDGTHTVQNTKVNKNDIFRINVAQTGGIFNLSIQIKIKLT